MITPQSLKVACLLCAAMLQAASCEGCARILVQLPSLEEYERKIIPLQPLCTGRNRSPRRDDSDGLTKSPVFD
jgi:hypothetical protein